MMFFGLDLSNGSVFLPVVGFPFLLLGIAWVVRQARNEKRAREAAREERRLEFKKMLYDMGLTVPHRGELSDHNVPMGPLGIGTPWHEPFDQESNRADE